VRTKQAAAEATASGVWRTSAVVLSWGAVMSTNRLLALLMSDSRSGLLTAAVAADAALKTHNNNTHTQPQQRSHNGGNSNTLMEQHISAHLSIAQHDVAIHKERARRVQQATQAAYPATCIAADAPHTFQVP
jgi:hypothetical protein